MTKAIHVIVFCYSLVLTSGMTYGQSIQRAGTKVPSPEYALWDGVKIACDAVICRGVQPSVSAIMEELYKMQKKNEVQLPFNPTWKWGSKVPTISEDMKQTQSNFENELARYIEKNCRFPFRFTGVYLIQPRPSQYLKKDHFVQAFVAHKMETVSDETRKAYSKKIGKMDDYRRDMQQEAQKIWNEVKGR